MSNNSPISRRPLGGRQPRLLVVEDDEAYAELIERAFQRINPAIPLQIVRDGRQAIQLLATPNCPVPDLILTDINMPVLGGFELLQWLKTRSRYYRTPVIMFSTSEDERDTARAYDLGAAAYLVKPMTFDALLTILKGTLSFWSLTAAPPLASKGPPGIETGLAWL